MHFEYSQYLMGCLLLPVVVSLFAASALISATSHLISIIARHKISYRDIITFLLAVLIGGFFLCMNIGRLLHGGIYLIYERETDAVELEGEILEIEELGRFSFPEINTEYGYDIPNGVQFKIKGIACTAIAKGVLDVGDHVTVIYLPQSGYILSISSGTK